MLVNGKEIRAIEPVHLQADVLIKAGWRPLADGEQPPADARGVYQVYDDTFHVLVPPAGKSFKLEPIFCPIYREKPGPGEMPAGPATD